VISPSQLRSGSRENAPDGDTTWVTLDLKDTHESGDTWDFHTIVSEILTGGFSLGAFFLALTTMVWAEESNGAALVLRENDLFVRGVEGALLYWIMREWSSRPWLSRQDSHLL
jgi:hypothetical protein